MKRRTSNEIEKDFKKIRQVVDSIHATSIKDIEKATNLSESEIKTSLSRHPRVANKIMAQLEKNKEEKKYQNKENVFNVKHKDVVIDASVAGIETIETILKDYINNSKIILTSVTIKELEQMQKYNDKDAMNARHILAMAVENSDDFQTVLIDENLDTPDDCIVKYCSDNKENVILITSDKSMALKSRMHGIETKYYKYRKQQKINTLFIAKQEGGKLCISALNNEEKSVMVISNGQVYTDGAHELKVGDEIYIATKKFKYLTFAHYRIISMEKENNSELIYSRRIYKKEDIKKMPRSKYKTFMREFNVVNV